MMTQEDRTKREHETPKHSTVAFARLAEEAAERYIESRAEQLARLTARLPDFSAATLQAMIAGAFEDGCKLAASWK